MEHLRNECTNNKPKQKDKYMKRKIQKEELDITLDMEDVEEMNENQPEEEYKPIKFKTAFWSVLGFHLFTLAGIAMYSSYSKAQASSLLEEDKKFLKPVAEMVGVEYPVEAKPTPSPTPEKKKEDIKPNPTLKPKPKVIERVPEKISPNYPNPRYTTEYVVKQGDTFNAIVKKYGLNAEKLKKINNIKDENKLMIGQKLKFM
jgi:LysM repeat protein